MTDFPSLAPAMERDPGRNVGVLQGILERLRGPGIVAASLRGTILSMAGFAAQKTLQLISNLILARLLFPEAFGLMALASVFLLGIGMFSDIGINASIVHSKRGEEEQFLNTAWTIKILRGLAIALVACLVAWPLAQFYQQPVLFPLLCALSSTAILQGLSSTAVATQNRNLQFRRIIVIDLTRDILTTTITISFALWWESVWALAAGAIAGDLIRTLLSHWLLPSHRLRFRLERRSVSEILRFGRWILLATLVNFIGGHGLPLIQGYLVSIQTLGLLAIAKTFAHAIEELASKLMNSVAFPALSRLFREQPENLGGVIRKVRVISNALTVSAFLLLSAIANPLIDLLYDPRYREAGDFLKVLAINGAIGFLQMLYQNVQLARGASRLHFCVMATMAVGRTAGMLIGFQVAGLNGMLYGLCAGSFITYLVSAALAARHDFASLKVDMVTILLIAGFWLIAF